MDMIAACVSKSPPLNESPSEKEGKCFLASVPSRYLQALNESPSEKEGKSEFESDKRGLFRCPQ